MRIRGTASSRNDRSLSADRERHADQVGQRRRARRGSEGSAAAAALRRRLAARRARRRPAAPGRLQGAGRRVRRIRVLRDPDELHRGQVARRRSRSGRATARSSTTSSCRRAPPQPERRPTGFRAGARHGRSRRGRPAAPKEPEGGRQAAARPEPLPARRERIGAMIGGFAPGTSTLKLEPGTAMLIRAGSTIVLQMHYTTNGTAHDRPHEARALLRQGGAEGRDADGHAGQRQAQDSRRRDADYSIAAEMTTTADVTLRQMLPHTHLRGKSWEYTATYPDGRTRGDPRRCRSTTSTGRPTTCSPSR